MINRDGPNILINLDGWTSAPLINEIFIMAPAPVQVPSVLSSKEFKMMNALNVATNLFPLLYDNDTSFTPSRACVLRYHTFH